MRATCRAARTSATTRPRLTRTGCGGLDLGFQRLHDLVKSALERGLAAAEDLDVAEFLPRGRFLSAGSAFSILSRGATGPTGSHADVDPEPCDGFGHHRLRGAAPSSARGAASLPGADGSPGVAETDAGIVLPGRDCPVPRRRCSTEHAGVLRILVAFRKRQRDCICKLLNIQMLTSMPEAGIPRCTPQRREGALPPPARRCSAVHAGHDTPSPAGAMSGSRGDIADEDIAFHFHPRAGGDDLGDEPAVEDLRLRSSVRACKHGS